MLTYFHKPRVHRSLVCKSNKILSDRFKALDRLDADRKLLLFQHLGFVTSPMREHCHSGYLNCTDTLVERIVAAKTAAAGRPASWSRTTDNNHLNLVVLGVENLADELADRIRTTVRTHHEFPTVKWICRILKFRGH